MDQYRTIDQRIERIAYRLNAREVSLYLHLDGSWQLMVGNPSSSVLLGEVPGIHNFHGDTAESAISQAERFATP